MTTMFPSLVPPNSGSNGGPDGGTNRDPNRNVQPWQPGDPIPRMVLVAMVIYAVVGVIMVLSAIGMLQLGWTRPAANPEEQQRMDFVLRNVRMLAVALIVFGTAIVGLSPMLRSGRVGWRRALLVVSVFSMFIMLGGWVLNFAPLGQAVLALMLAVASLMVYRPAVNPFFRRKGWSPAE